MEQNDIYREELLEHYRHPQNFGTLKKPTLSAAASNPICGDQLTLEVSVNSKGIVTDVAFNATGCLLSIASASKFTEWMRGKSLKQLKNTKEEKVLELLEAPITAARRHCALLVYSALKKVL